ncbi:signal peptide peptidase SppA [Alteromonas oceanisediminis]|uniref:signal peptide peptidase SppA n=1 Tax=Alteromonas oceanisediminis TaxID=2836180 RepID=UPI001BDAF13A|nr:signal peptide peptidase SppA [Alteromonas oceanisediminis]MBT0586568.1 signal peptide peptidase SppA [Alteromonas oceanisediminis]
MASGGSWTKSFFTGIWSVLNFSRKLVFNLIFILLIVGIVIAVSSGDDGKVIVPQDSALVLNLKGQLVIEKTAVDPFQSFVDEAFEQEPENPEVLVSDVVMAIENAKEDNRIKLLILDVQGLMGGGLDKLRTVSEAVIDFKQSGKPVFAIGDYYSQDQYYVAAHADHVYLHPMGGMLLEGYGRYRTYFKEALEKLKLTTHIFRVGTFKSAVEPYIRNDMSDAAKQANSAWLDVYWDQYKADVARARDIDASNFDEALDVLVEKMQAVDGDFARYALENGWVDQLKTREQIRTEMIELVGEDDDKKGFNAISYDSYLSVINPPLAIPSSAENAVGIVVAKGVILNGNQKAGTIGGDSTARLLRQARLDENVKAVVLHVDSPGGSAFASEVIRNEVELLKQSGKPVVAKMGTYAASGGYWISASADRIIASPSTITGSIGVFGMFMSYENTLKYLGVYTDGVGTTELAGISPARALDPRVAQIIQTSIEHSYDQFINLVADERALNVARVNEIAQGRVWIGETALDLGLVDELGDLDRAVAVAAELADLDDYEARDIERELSPKERFWKEFFGQASVWAAGSGIGASESYAAGLFKQVVSQFDSIAQLNDPRGVYAMCVACEID